MISLLMIGLSAFGFLLSPFCGTGYLVSGFVALVCVTLFRRLALAQRIGHAVTTLKRENDEFADENDRLRQANDRLELTTTTLTDDLSTLTSAMRDVGENSRDFMDKLHGMYERYRTENVRHQTLLTQQSRLLLLQVFTHFDADLSATLSAEELRQAQTHLQSLLPNVRLEELEEMVRNKEVTLRDIEGLIQ